MADLWLGLRSIVWTVLLPGVVAGYVPWQFFGLRSLEVDDWTARAIAGVTLVGVGITILIVCVWEFAHRGRGTLAPVDPPRVLVVTGVYRYVRNPMYLAITLVLLGEAVVTWRPALAVYWAAWFAIVNAFVLGYEEPRLRAQFGASYDRYTRQVHRWVPRVPRSQ